jgi:hypothetical protein
LTHIDPWMALAAFGLFVPQIVFVPLLQAAVNRHTGARIRVLRQLGISMLGGAIILRHAVASALDRVIAFPRSILSR